MEPVTVVTEGTTDRAVALRLCQHSELVVARAIVAGGKGTLDQKLAGYNRAAKGMRWLVLRDLDHDADCAPDLVRERLSHPSSRMLFRVAVREVEAWLLADASGVAGFLGVAESRVPTRPEELDDPKQELIRIARRSRKRAVRDAIVPREGSGAVEGPLYITTITEFALLHWRPDEAAGRSESLRRCMARLRDWASE